MRTSCGSHAGSCGRKQSPAEGRSRSLRWPQGHSPAAPSLGWRGDGASRAEPSQAGCRRIGRPRALSVRSVFSAAIDCRPVRFPYPTRRCGGEGTQEPEPPIAPVQSFSRLFKVVQSLKSVRSKSVQTFQISLRRRLRSTAFRRISSNNPERGCAMRLCPDDDLTGPTGRGHRPPSFTCTAGADAAVFPAAPALAASVVLKTAATAGRHRTGSHAGGGLRARSPPPASGCCQHEWSADSQPPQAPDANINAHVSNCTCLHHHRQNPARPSDNDDSPKQ